MRIDNINNPTTHGYEIKITLSERNLRSLLNKLKRDDSAHTIQKYGPRGTLFSIVAEKDEPHYGARVPGVVHPIDDPTGEYDVG